MGRRGIIHGVSGVGCLLSVLGCGDAGGGAGGGGGAGPVLDVTIDSGPIEGKLVGSTRAFLGIPYAAAPVGDLRFRSPQPVEPWTDTRAYTEVGPGCPQSPVFVTTVSEDCLTLNVWTPAAPSSAALPVMVFLHGGAFVGGSGGQINYDGQRLSESGRVIVVTINYRLGPLGFLSHPALAAEDPAHATSGMYGLEDQTAALAWVKANAAAFGGDPGNVTIFGESAGGISACLHLVMPASAGLFDRAIIESGPCDLFELPTNTAANAEGAALATAVGCDGADVPGCLRQQTPEALAAALDVEGVLPGGLLYGSFRTAYWWPHADGVVVPADVEAKFAAGEFAHVPTVLGTMADEGRALLSPLLADAPFTTDEELAAGLGRVFAASDVPKILAEYPSSSLGGPAEAADRIGGDGFFVCPTRALARALSADGTPTFLYTFEGVVSGGLVASYGATHAVDTLFVFGNDWPAFGSIGQAGEPLVAAVQGYWSRLALAGDPNGEGAPDWPAFTAASDAHLVLGDTVSASTGLGADHCDFWDTIARPTLPLFRTE